MIADETIHLPSINQISKLMKGIEFDLDEEIPYKNNIIIQRRNKGKKKRN